MCKKIVFCVALISAILGSAEGFAENGDANLLALDDSKQGGLYNADDDILAAMQALDEVGALLKDTKDASDNAVDVDALLAAAGAPEAHQTAVKKEEPTKNAPVVAAKVEKIEKVEKTEPKHELQSAPVKEAAKAEAPVVAAKVEKIEKVEKTEPKHEIQSAPVKEAAKSEAPVVAAKIEKVEKSEAKHEIQSAPVKEAAKAEAPVVAAKVEKIEKVEKTEPKHELQSAPVKEAAKAEAPVVAAKVEKVEKVEKTEPKHELQSAPVKEAAKAEAPVVAAKVEKVEKVEKTEPKHELQSAPVKEAAKAEAPVVAAKVEKVEKTEPKHELQSAPVKEAAKAEAPVVAAKAAPKPENKTVASDGTHVVKTNSNAQVSVDPLNAPHTLAMKYVMAIYQLNGVDLSKVKKPMPTIAELYQHAFKQKLVYQSTKPAVGDLAFFHNTVDRNRDGRWNDWHSLVGIVESVDSDETISVLIYQKDKIERIHLNMKYPELQRGKKGQELNSQLRADEGAQKGTASKLFAGFANLLGDIPSVTVVDNWKPGMKLSK